MRAVILPLLLITVLFTGCASQPSVTPPAYSETDLNSFEGFSQALVKTMNAKDTTLFIDRMDTQQFARRSLTSLGLVRIKEKTVNAYASIMGKALKKRYKQTFDEVKSASFIRMMPGDANGGDEGVGLIRIQPEDGGINYWKVYLRRSEDRIHIVDWFSYSLGDLASRSLGSFVLQAGIASLKPETADAAAIQNYLAAAQSSRPQDQLDAYSQLPPRLKNNSLIMFAHVQTAMKVSDDTYRRVLHELAPNYRKNDNYALMLVDYYVLNENFAKAHQAISTMESKLGKDAGLDSLHAGIALQDGNYPRAIRHARDGINREAAYEDNYWVLLDALVYSKNYSEAVLVLSILQEGFSYQFDTRQMATLEGYEDFSRSEAFNSWKTAAK